MKRIRIIGSIFSIIALLVCFWSIYALTQDGADMVTSFLNLLYFLSLLIAILCFRLSLGYSNKINLVIGMFSLGVIGSSTYTWMNPDELVESGKITLGLLPLLLGTTLMLIVKAHSATSKFLQLLIGLTSVTISACVFLGISTPIIYTIAVCGLGIITLFVLAYLIIARTN